MTERRRFPSVRVLIVSHNYPRFRDDPAGAFVATIARAASNRGHDVHVVTPHARGAARGTMDSGIAVTRFRYAPAPFEVVAYRGASRRTLWEALVAGVSLPGFLLAFRRAVRREVSTFAPHVVHAHWWFPAGWVAGAAQCPFIVTCHGSDVRLLDNNRFARGVARRVVASAFAVTAVSRFLADDLVQLVGTNRRIPVTRMPVDAERFERRGGTPKVEPPRILFAGNLVESKGVDVLMRAFQILREKRIDCELQILGDGPEQRRLKELAREIGVEEHVHWSGVASQAEMPSAYAASTITVLPSRRNSEGLGLTLVEALLAGSAVVGTAAGGIPEVISHEGTGLIAQPDDPSDLARQMERLLSDPDLRERLAKAGYSHVRSTYATDVAVEPFLELYDAAADHAVG